MPTIRRKVDATTTAAIYHLVTEKGMPFCEVAALFDLTPDLVEMIVSFQQEEEAAARADG